jgi:molecular chaperone GrpE (heat shock protein)
MTDKSCINCKFIEECIRRSLTPDKSLEIYINCIRKDERSKLESENFDLKACNKKAVKFNIKALDKIAALKKEIASVTESYRRNARSLAEMDARWEKLEGQLKRFPFERLTIDAILQTMQELENGGEVHAVSDECRVWDSKENKEIKSLLKSLRKSKPNEYPAPFWAVKLIDRKKTKPSNPKGVK